MASAGLCLALAILVTAVCGEEDDPRLAEELKCLDTGPADLCSMMVVYPEPVESLLCDALTTDTDAQALTKVPELIVTSKLAGLKGLLVMFDPDAPVSDEPQDGFVHFIAQVTVDSAGKIKVDKIITDYYPPTPPRKTGPHRYQFFLFDYEDGSPIPPTSQRKFQICSFMRSNNVDQPVAAFQFRHVRE